MATTPGPWKIGEMYAEHGLTNNDGSIVVMGDNGEQRVCVVDYIGDASPRKRYSAPSKTRDANARLIAAAPDLLAALKDILRTCPRNSTDPAAKRYFQWVSDEARAAIAKAEGRL